MRNIFKDCITYLRDNPEHYWFKAKCYGWGWVPVKWQGWVVTTIFISILLLNGLYFESKVSANTNPTTFDQSLFFGVIVISVTLLFWICYKKGEKPRWNWGPPKSRT